MAMNPTHSQKAQALSMLVDTIMESIRAAGPMGAPEGHLYAALMTIPNFRVEHLDMILDALVKAGKVTRGNHVVRAR
jgi:hypothetical protein